ncbi:MAG: tRNA-specific 2-thiouridylase MnmA [Eubacteriales bacterium SKADARSKE-1]|nr:tRNA-specific 2-thiouridylase MnmA [Eubacteriales bacterium SKADARSKE-1]
MKKVMLLMSGGVDSSVSAILLQQQGYDVTGATMHLKTDQDEKSNAEIKDAKLVAEKLKIKHMVVNLSNDFSDKVIKNFIGEYLLGRTPNPCVVCNKYIKFGKMFKLAKKLGFDYIATGHYAVVDYDKSTGKWLLKKSDEKKDQSYVLYNLNQEKLSHILFPVGNMQKDEIRKIAKEYDLPIAEKKESQEICFIKDNDYCNFIESHTNNSPPKGLFINENGSVLGEHQGIMKYTIGQRKGFGIGFGKPMYVISINPQDNTVVLGEEGSQYTNELIATNLNFILFDKPLKEMEITAKVRYKAPCAKAKLVPLDENFVKVIFYEKQRAITPGQSVVFYDGDVVLGGGVITSSK